MSSALFSPIELGSVVLPNRIVVSPMCQYSAQDGIAQIWHWFHLGAMARSGAGLLILEATGVEAIGRITPLCLGLYTDAQEAALTRLVQDIRQVSSIKLGIQLAHAGRKGGVAAPSDGGKAVAIAEGGWQPVAPSPVAYDASYWTPLELDAAGLEQVRAAFVQAAIRADRCGFDLVELHAAHGYLLNQFASPLANFRTDAYGGSLENRLRFPLEVAAAIRAVWPAHKALGCRINGSDWHERGLTPDDAVVFARGLQALGFDYVTTSAGSCAPDIKIPPVVPGYMVPFSEQVRAETGIKTMAVGMILTGRQAEAIIAEGQADMVAIARGFLDDPNWAHHAAFNLGIDPAYLPQYRRAGPRSWPGYKLVHPKP